jgi:ergothioneine biosynthesis protein EgtB
MHASHAQQLDPNSLRCRYQTIRDATLELTEPFSAEDQQLQSMPDASPAKWHKAHTTWFFETFILSTRIPGYRPFNSEFKQLFNSYYKQLGSHPLRGSRGLMSRPSLEEVHAYRAWVDDAMLRYLEGDEVGESTAPLIELGLNHEQQHQELILTDLKHALWSMPLRPHSACRPRAVSSAPPLEWIGFDGGIHQIGHAGDGFSFDNEGPRHDVLLQPFQLASRLVTNGEYLEFMRDGGYQKPELWLSDGWDAVCAQSWNSPMYWEHNRNVNDDSGTSLEFTYSGMLEVDSSSPVCHVSFYEADAFARWSNARLPREEEWEVAAVQAASNSGSSESSTTESGLPEVRNGAFQEDGIFHPQPARGAGLQQLFGDVWEWTASPYLGYPGFKPAPGLVGEYNGKFMCNQFVLRGGSCATPASHIRATYRNFFPPHARWQFMGIRLAK